MNPGSIVLQRAKFDLSSACITLHSLAMLQKPRFVHAGVYLGDGQMMTASLLPGVSLQKLDARFDTVVPYVWQDWPKAKAWLLAQEGKPYDSAAWVLCAVERVDLGVRHYLNNGDRYMCSTIVGCAMREDNPSLPALLSCRCLTPNDLGKFLGI